MPESKSTSKQSYSSRGKYCEDKAIEHFTQSLKYTFVTRNLRLFYAEIDLLLISPDGDLVFVEVKSVNEDLVWRSPVGKNQLSRLKRTFENLVSTSVRPVRAHLAAVNQCGEVTVFYDFLS